MVDLILKYVDVNPFELCKILVTAVVDGVLALFIIIIFFNYIYFGKSQYFLSVKL